MNAKNLFKFYVLTMGGLGLALSNQFGPDRPFILNFGQGVVVGVLLPGIIISKVGTGHLEPVLVFLGSLIFWGAFYTLFKPGKKSAPVRRRPTGTITIGTRTRRREYWEEF